MQLANINAQQIQQVDLQRVLNEAIINKYIEMEKYRRYKVGCAPSVCILERLMFLSDNVCTDKCYLSENDYKIINESIRKNG